MKIKYFYHTIFIIIAKNLHQQPLVIDSFQEMNCITIKRVGKFRQGINLIPWFR